MTRCQICGDPAVLACPGCILICRTCLDWHVLSKHIERVSCPVCGDHDVFWCTLCDKLYCDEHLVKHFEEEHLKLLSENC